MKIIVIGHGMVGHKLVECLAQDAAHGLDITVLCEEPRPAYDRVHLSEFFSGKSAEDLSLVSPGFFERDDASRRKYLDEHFLLEAWDRSDPLYLIIDEGRVDYWRRLITDRVHIYHQVTSCGSRVILSNQL